MQKELDILHSTPERITFSMKKQKSTILRTNNLFQYFHICSTYVIGPFQVVQSTSSGHLKGCTGRLTYLLR